MELSAFLQMVDDEVRFCSIPLTWSIHTVGRSMALRLDAPDDTHTQMGIAYVELERMGRDALRIFVREAIGRLMSYRAVKFEANWRSPWEHE